MPVYVDNMKASYRRMKMCHMVADSIDELLDMADKIGMQRKWLQPLSHPHFDVSLTRRALAVAHGAIQVDRRELYSAMKRHRALWRVDAEELAKIRSAARDAGHPAFDLKRK